MKLGTVSFSFSPRSSGETSETVDRLTSCLFGKTRPYLCPGGGLGTLGCGKDHGLDLQTEWVMRSVSAPRRAHVCIKCFRKYLWFLLKTAVQP